MASIWKHPSSKFYSACFTDKNGVRRKRSTKTTNRKEAQRIADEFENAAVNHQTSAQTRKVISDLHKNLTGDDLAKVTARSFIEGWLEDKKPTVAPATMAFYRNATSKFLGFLGAKADLELGEINRNDIIAFRNSESEKVSPKTVNHALKCIKMVFRAGRRDSILVTDPAEFVDTVRDRKAATRRPFTMPEIQEVLRVADGEWRSMIYFGLYTGQRLGDIAMLQWKNIDLDRGEIRLITRKTGKSMILPIPATLRRNLNALPTPRKPDDALHPRAFAITSQQGKSGHLSNQFADILAKAGLRLKQPHRKKEIGAGRRETAQISFHCLRHTAVTILKEAGIPASVVMAWAGHDSVAMSELYTHVGSPALKSAADAIPDVLAS